MRQLFTLIVFLFGCNGLAHAADATPIRVDIGPQLIERADFEDQGLWVKLNPKGTEYLRQLSARNHGRTLDVYVLEEPALKTAVWTTMDTGTINVANPSDKLVRKVTPYVHSQDTP